jgi:SAM-dependent methyltransferase
MLETVEQKVAQFGKQISPGSWFLSKQADIDEHRELLPYSHYVRQAWNELRLQGVLCVDGRPTVYLCADVQFTPDAKRKHHSFVWNQGLVPLLIFLTPERVEVHSTVKRPHKESDQGLFKGDLPSLIPNLGNIAEVLEAAKLVRSIETGTFFQDNASFFPANETVDRCLMENLKYTARKLTTTGSWSLSRAHALLGRALFISFLQQRKFIKPDYYPDGTETLLDILRRPRVDEIKRLLYREFFQCLKREFNGTMFDAGLADEERHINKAHLDILRDFLSGDDMKSGQMTLDFQTYDFRFIPVETISAIYEQFMKDGDLKKKREEGAYYTPRHLAETTLHMALDGRYDTAARCKVLDPACGSGIFLVAMFNLFAEIWLQGNRNSRKQTRAQALLGILQRQIRGVDRNPDACRIAAFSLYLALFEKLRPMDIEEFKEKVRQGPFLPLLLWTADEQIESPVILQGDFLKDSLPLGDDFDFIIGNPPWESRGDKQIALQFAKRSPDFLRDGGIGCLLLPSTITVNRHGTLDGAWFRAVTVEKIVQLADFRRVLFEAKHPCFIIRFVKAPPTLEHIVIYETPKLNRFDRQSGVFVVEPDDQKFISQHEILEASLSGGLQKIWTRKFWGTPRDESFLRRLDFYPRLSDYVGNGKKWHEGVGFKPFYPGASQGEPKPIKPWRLSDDYIENDSQFPQLALTKANFTSLKTGLDNSVHQKRRIPASLEFLHRKPADTVFQGPMLLFSEGFTKFAFCHDRVLFQNSLRSIKARNSADADLLRFLTAVLGSRLMRYHAFHSGSSNGIEREKLHLYEILNLPFALPEDELAPHEADEIIREAAGIIKHLERADEERKAEDVNSARQALQPLVERYFGVTDAERILIDDTLRISQPSIHRPSLDGDIPSLAFPESEDRKRYADTLCDVLNRRARKEGIKISAEAMASKELGLILFTVLFSDTRRPYAEVGGDLELWKALDSVATAAKHRTGSFSYLRGFRYFEPDRLHLLKPATMRNWCRTAALNEADAIFEHLVTQSA